MWNLNTIANLPKELAERFIASLHNLAADCKYGELKNEMIRDRIVIGIRDLSLSERLQLDPGVTLQRPKL